MPSRWGRSGSRVVLVALLAMLLQSWPAAAQEVGNPTPARSLDELLDMVREGWSEERKQNRVRETRFKNEKREQSALLSDAKGALGEQESQSQELEFSFEQNDVELAKLEVTLQERLGTLGELFGVVRQVAGETRQQLENSLVSAQLGPRNEFLAELGRSKSLPSIDALRRL